MRARGRFRTAASLVAGCGLLALALTSRSTLAEPLFKAPFLGLSANAASPTFIAQGDFDADGRRDLVAVQTVWLGQGDGTFRTSQSFSAPSPRCVAVGDVNGDGRLDLAITTGLTEVEIVLANGDGTFGANLLISYGTSVATCALADMNADGKLDLITTSYNDSVISIRRGNGDGTFSPFKSDFGTGPRPWYFILGDVNGDNKLDAVVVNNNNNNVGATVSVLIGTGTGSFLTKTDYPVASGAVYAAIGDLNGDLLPDIAVACSYDNQVSILLGSGGGVFTAGTSVPTGNFPAGIVISDLNEDGHADLAVTLGDGGAITGVPGLEVHAGTGAGTFLAPTLWVTGNIPDFLISTDWDGDGHVDLAMANLAGLSVLLGNGDGSFGFQRRFSTADAPVGVAAGDLNGDNRPDLVTANAVAGSISVGLGNGDGTFGTKTDFPMGTSPSGIVLGHFDSDGLLDVAVSNRGSNNVSVRLGAGGGTFGGVTDFAVGTAPAMVAKGDFNGDGKLDLITLNSGAASFSVLLGDGAGSFQPKLDQITPAGPSALGLGDLNLDGKLDVVVISSNNSFSGTLSVWLGNGNGSFGPRTDYTGDPLLSVVGIADVNGDGKPDVVDAGGGKVELRLGNGNGTLQPATSYVVSGPATSLAFADVDLDGRTDIVLALGSANWVGVITAPGALDTPYFGSGRNVVAVAATDINGDGSPDLLGVNQDTNDVSVLLNTRSLLGVPPIGASAPLPLATFPNPAHATTTLRFALQRGGNVSVRVYDLAGRMVRCLLDGTVPAGPRSLVWDLRDADGRRMSPGVYLAEVRCGGSSFRQRVAVIW